MSFSHLKGKIVTLFLLELICRSLCQTYEGDACSDQYTFTAGKCTLAEKCRTAMEDLRVNGIRPTYCSYTFDSVLVCCRDDSTILQLPTQNVNPVNTRVTTERVSERKCNEYSKLVTQTVNFGALLPDSDPMSFTTANCNYTEKELIFGGKDARLGEFPHMALLGWSSQGKYSFDCGGTLISPRFVLTAAHCTYAKSADDPEPVVVRLGEHNVKSRVNDGAHPVDVPIRTIHKYPTYRSPLHYHDIALIELRVDVEFSNSIRPACLWSNTDFAGNTQAIITGWGVFDPQTRQKADVLQRATLSLLSNEDCNTTLSNIINRKWWGMTDEQLCAGELRGGRDTCEGDSGGPIQIVSETNQCIFHVIGVTAFGPSFCGSNPAVYTRVSSYVDWIESVVWPNQ